MKYIVKMETRLTSLLKLDVPIVQAPIGTATTVALVSEVSKAGALGTLSITWRSMDQSRAMIRAIKQKTNRPFGVNIVLTIDPHEKIEMCLEEGVKVISFFWGDPRSFIDVIHSRGTLVMHTVGNASEAKLYFKAGVDILVAQGIEAGGHIWGKTPLKSLISEVRAHVPDAVLVAAGGIADSDDVRYALRMGADGVSMGTRFVASREADAHPTYLKKLMEAKASDTVYTTLFDGGWPNAPHRVLRTKLVSQWEREGMKPRGQKPNEAEVIGHLESGESVMAYDDSFPSATATGEIEKFPLYAGESVGKTNDIKSAAGIVEELRLALDGAVN